MNDRKCLWVAPLLVYEAEFQITLPPHLSSLGLKDTDGRLAGIQPKRSVPIGCQAVKRETSHLPVNCLRSLWHQMSLECSWATTYVVAILVLITLIYPNGPPIALNRKLGVSAKARIRINHLRVWHSAHKLCLVSPGGNEASVWYLNTNHMAKSICFGAWPSIRPLLDFSQVDAHRFDLQY